jgi:hypothetical protein
VLILYQHSYMYVRTISHYLESFYRYSKFNVSYASSIGHCHFDLDYFDAVVLHYSVRVFYPGHLSRSFAKALKKYAGLKMMFLQDEYEATNQTRANIQRLGINVVFTCVPQESIRTVYPEDSLGDVRFVPILTGYVPEGLDRIVPSRPLAQRSVLIGYRGRNIGYWYGDLGQEKQFIGEKMKEICDQRGLKTDIAWREEDRIYGDDWFHFLGSCKATLGTESGANVFDYDGSLAQNVQRDLLKNPGLSYRDIHDKYLRGRDGEVVMNQISPKLFEAIACKTALILFEGRYSDVLEPHRHFIPLKKDFSNIDEVLNKLRDDALLEQMTQRAFDDIVRSGKYSYQSFVREFDEVLETSMPARERAAPAWLPLPPCDALPSFTRKYQRNFRLHFLKRVWRRLPGPVQFVLRPLTSSQRLKTWWIQLPKPLKFILRPLHYLRNMILYKGH